MSRLLSASALVGFLGVAMGAFGAHALENRLTVESQNWWETATFYALTHAVTSLAIALHNNGEQKSNLHKSGWCFLTGTMIFSGSLYLMALGGPRWLGAITPVGGLSMLLGWGMIVLYHFNHDADNKESGI